MSCSSCGGGRAVNMANVKETKAGTKAQAAPVPAPAPTPLMAGKSASSNLVKLRYQGGGMATKHKSGSGCKSCGGSRSQYSVVTKEQIMFVSDDAPNGLFKETFSVGHDYYVTEEQAKILLSMEYKDMGGKVKHKFEEIK